MSQFVLEYPIFALNSDFGYEFCVFLSSKIYVLLFALNSESGIWVFFSNFFHFVKINPIFALKLATNTFWV